LRDADCSRLLGLPAPQFNAWRPHREIIAPDLPKNWRIEPASTDLVPITIPAGIEVISGVVLVSPHGYRVEGLNFAQAYALLRELS
jgi:hypothetical protein